jgi:translation initiation factor 2 subunit 2
MDYEQMLGDAYENLVVNEEVSSERFEIIKVTGHHQGNRTIITNFGKVVAHLRRDAGEIVKYLSKALATTGQVDGDRLILNRKVSSKEVNDRITKYVGEYVLCKKCKKPDTELIEEGGKLYLRCLACGLRAEVHRI